MSAKIFQGVNHLWTQLLLVRIHQMKNPSNRLNYYCCKYARTGKLATDSSAREEKDKYKYMPEEPRSDPSWSDSLSSESDSSDDRNYKGKRFDKGKIIGKARNMTHQTHRQATLICPTKVIIEAKDSTKRRSTGNKKK